jgi:phage terminase large subunit-like protein
MDGRAEICGYCDTPTWCEFTTRGRPYCLACRVERYFDHILFAPIGFRLLKWQRDVLRKIYGTVDVETGERIYRQAYIEVPKKNGKSFLVGGLPIYHLMMEHERNPEAFGAATTRSQGGLVFNASAEMIRSNPDLAAALKVVPSTLTIRRRDMGGSYKVLSGDGRWGDGVGPSLVIKDEYHLWRSARSHMLDNVLTKGMAVRQQPLEVKITTAGEIYDAPLCYREHEFARQVIDGTLKSDHYFAAIWSADAKRVAAEPEYWQSRAARVAANPSHEDHGGFLRDSALEMEMERAVNDPPRRGDYLRYNLNLWVDAAERYISAEEWAKCAGPLRPLIGRACYIGVDLSSTIDLTAMVCLFPDDDGTYDVLPFFWMAEGQIETRERLDRAPYKVWAAGGYLELSHSWAIDEEDVRRKIQWACENFEVLQIGYDPRFATSLVNKLVSEDGLICVKVAQSFPNLTEPTKSIKALAGAGLLRHADHPVLRWNCDCATAISDRKEGVVFAKPDRGKTGKRIDGMSALANAGFLGFAKAKSSAYEERGVLSL